MNFLREVSVVNPAWHCFHQGLLFSCHWDKFITHQGFHFYDVYEIICELPQPTGNMHISLFSGHCLCDSNLHALYIHLTCFPPT